MRYSVFAVMLLITVVSKGQTTDLARVEYTYFPQDESKNSFSRFRTLMNVPLRVKNDNYIVIGLEYRNINLKLRDPLPIESDNKERLESFNFSLGYTFKMQNEWRFGAKAGFIVASNFRQKVEKDDFIFEGGLFFIKEQRVNEAEVEDEPWRLILGVTYSTIAGRPYPLPYVNYYKRFKPNWSYVLGAPKTNIKYLFDEKNIVQAFVTLDGFFANIQGNENFIDNKVAESISMTTVLSGLGYEHYFSDHILFYVYGGHTIINDIRLRDENGDDVYTINDSNSYYFRGGIKFKI